MSNFITNWFKKYFNEGYLNGDNNGEIVKPTVKPVFKLDPVIGKIIEKVNKDEYECGRGLDNCIILKFGETEVVVFVMETDNKCWAVHVRINDVAYDICVLNQNELYIALKKNFAIAKWKAQKENALKLEKGRLEILGTN